ncbi:MAG: MerR family DNA-binding transcriptional regulator [Actinomycetota bacterium]|nr:MerR family DNA-binding transcriptional regulator [Actinomycetota bacterium]
MDDELLTTGEVARRLGVSATAVKRWEAAGLLPLAARTVPGNRRVWRASAVEAVRGRIEHRRGLGKEAVVAMSH